MKKVTISLIISALFFLFISSVVEAQTPSKISSSLIEVLKTKQDQEIVKVAIWLHGSAAQAADTIAKNYPKAKLIGQRPGKDTDIKIYETISKEMNEARRQAYRAAQLPVEQSIKARGFEITYSVNYWCSSSLSIWHYWNKYKDRRY